MLEAQRVDKVQSIAVPTSRLDARASKTLLKEAQLAFESGFANLVVDLSNVTQVDSLGISALVAIKERAPTGCRVVLAGLGAQAKAIARITRLHEVFDIYATVDAAEAGLQ